MIRDGEERSEQKLEKARQKFSGLSVVLFVTKKKLSKASGYGLLTRVPSFS